MLGFLLFLLTPFARLLVIILAVRGKYPAWLVTPDSPTSPFGQYEPAVKAVYERWGRYVGDVYWLGFRNTLYGLAYELKPDLLKRLYDYSQVTRKLNIKRWYKVVTVAWYGFGFDNRYYDYEVTRIHEITLTLGPVAVILGYRLSPVFDNNGPLVHPNMDGRPIFSIRLRKNA